MEKQTRAGVTTTMNIQSAINKELFIPHDEQMLLVVEVQRRRKKRMSFLPTPYKGDYSTYICVSVTNSRPRQLLITKVKRFGGSSSFTKRFQWSVEQLRQVNGINPNKDSPEFDLVFDNRVDQWVAGSSAEKCLFIQILYRACETYWKGKQGSEGTLGKLSKTGQQRRGSRYTPPEARSSPEESPVVPKILKTRRKSVVPPRQTEFLNCQSKLTRDARSINLLFYRCKVFLNRVKNVILTNRLSPRPEKTQFGHRAAEGTIANIAQKMNVSLRERGNKLTHAEDKTVKMMHKAQQFADMAHMLALRTSK